MTVRLRVALLLTGLALGLGSAASDGEPLPHRLTVATYNVANYNLSDRQVEGIYRRDYPKPEAEKDALREVITALNADVLALQEIGGTPYLAELQRDLRRGGMDYPYAVGLEAADEVRRVAVLSRWPFAAVNRHTDLDFAYFEGRETVKRGMLEVRFATAAGEVTLFVVHLKSRLTEREDDPAAAQRRGREATAARDRILEQFPDPANARFLILGDFNEGPLGRPLRAFTVRGEQEIARPVAATDSRGETWTHFYRRNDEYSRVDYVMVSPGLAPRVRHPRIYDGPGVDAASDHRPVMVTVSEAP